MTQDALPGVVDDTACVVVPDPVGPRRRAMVERACRDHVASLGPSRALAQARESLGWARLGLDAVQAGALQVQFAAVDDHLAAIALFDAREPMRELASRRLSALESVSGQAGEKMRETLRAYLDHRGNAAAMATDLHLHPQTVRYRLRKLRELFGDELDDSQARFELDLALRSRRIAP
jgi:DNA-binding PucR family transcriptional regulator